jgi:Na+/H+ antiporter NhaC
MAILYPLVLPSTWVICQDAGLSQAETMPIFYNAISVVLAGSVFGDHCSPISDTTVLSSLASSCNHIDHVRTQLPYAITVGLVSLLTGGLLFSLRVPWYLNYVIGLVILYLLVRFLGKKSHERELFEEG